MKRDGILVLVIIVCSIIIAACSTDEDVTRETNGRLLIELTDAPFPTDLVSEANVTISKIEIRMSDEDSSAFVVLSEEEASFNLLDLTNGVTASLVDKELEAGMYDLIRMHVADASIVLKDGTTFDLFIPSGAQTGIKIFIKPALEVVGGLTSGLLLDFDVSRSFVVKGNPNTPAGIKGFIFKPTIKASNISTSGGLVGVVTDSLDVGVNGATVSVLAADTVNTSTITSESGAYSVLGLSAGTYDITVEYEGYEMVTIEGIEIVAGNTTTQDVKFTE